MDETTSRDDVHLKPDVLSRETTLGDGQVEKLPSTDEPIPGPGLNNDDDDDDDDEASNAHRRSGSNDGEPPRGRAGYTHLAQTMTQTQLGMVRKYKELSLLNLLYLQAEIHQLQTDWEYQVAADARPDADPRRRQWDYHWWAMVDGRAQGLGGQRWEAWLKLREKLYEYYDAIQKHERIVALPCPNNDQRQLVSEYIWNDDLNGGRGAFLSPELRGDNPEMYREEWLDDLVVFEHVAESMDAFARWVTQPLLEAAHFCCLGRGKKPLQEDIESRLPHGENGIHLSNNGPRPAVPLYQYGATSYTMLNRTLNSIMIILLPCASIVSLNAVPDTNKRVGMVCAFSLVCAVGMSLCSSASRMELFAVTAAFMSVQLVFVGQQQGGPST